jgi:TPR repeat protein
MKLLRTIVAVCLLVTPAAAQDFAQGWTAYKHGDFPAAHSQWQPMAEQNHAKAQFWLAFLYDIGLGVPEDAGTAAHWYAKSAAGGHAEAQYEIGMRYYAGVGVMKNRPEAANWLNRAAHQGHVHAQSWLAFMYGQGDGVQTDLVKAYMWYAIASLPDHHGPARSIESTVVRMTDEELTEADRLARAWLRKHQQP